MYKITYKNGLLKIQGIVYVTIKIEDDKEKDRIEKNIRELQLKLLKELTIEGKNENK